MRHRQCPRPLPTCWLFTDERIATAALLRAVRRLPRGSGIVFRHYGTDAVERRALFDRVARMARRRGLMLLLGGPIGQARLWGADGAHARSAPVRRNESRRYRAIRSAPVHDMAERRAAERAGADLLFLSPLFATRSHPGARPLGSYRFARIARSTPLPVMALGGVSMRHRALLARLGAAGFGAIDGLSHLSQ